MLATAVQKLFIVLIILGMPVGAWYFIRSAVASGVRAAHRRDDGPPADQPGSDRD